MLTVGDLFSGIGGFSLGLERAGMRTLWFAETDAYASAVLRKHWPDVPNHGDVRSISAGSVERVDVLCGGFPCQDISNAGKRAGIDGERSGLWGEYARIVGELRPRFVIVENVAALLGRGIERVLGDLAALGFDAEWHCIPASAAGAPHRRDRVWIIAYADCRGQQEREKFYGAAALSSAVWSSCGRYADRLRDAVGNGNGAGLAQRETDQCRQALTTTQAIERASSPRGDAGVFAARAARHWLVEPDVGRVAHGIPSRVDRLRALGNAVVPQVVEVIGRQLLASIEAAA